MAEGDQFQKVKADSPSPAASPDQMKAPAPVATSPAASSTSGVAQMVATQRPEAQPFPWDIASAVALLGVVVAAVMVVWQHRSATRSQLKLGLFQSLTNHVQEAANAASKLSSYVRAIPLDFATARASHELGSPFAPRARMPQLLELNRAFMEAALRAFVQIEHHAILTPHAKLFQMALGSACYDVTKASEKANRALTLMLPVHVPQGLTYTPDPPDEQQEAALFSTLDTYVAAVETLDMYLADIQRELQRILLTPLFPKKHAARRVPIDPRFRVIATDKASVRELENYFLHESAWGLNNKKAEEEVRLTLAQK